MGEKRKIPGSNYDGETQNKILDVATELFAIKGYDAVSMRDIANSVGIKMSSIYYYYDGKEALLKDVLSNFETGYRHYFEWLKEKNAKADSLDAVMDNMFNREFVDRLNPLSNLGISIALKEQHNNEYARNCVFELFYKYSIECLQRDFDTLVEKGIIPPSDTKTVATTFMFNVLIGNDISLHEFKDSKPPIHSKEVYDNLKKLLTAALKQGNVESD